VVKPVFPCCGHSFLHLLSAGIDQPEHHRSPGREPLPGIIEDKGEEDLVPGAPNPPFSVEKSLDAVDDFRTGYIKITEGKGGSVVKPEVPGLGALTGHGHERFPGKGEGGHPGRSRMALSQQLVLEIVYRNLRLIEGKGGPEAAHHKGVTETTALLGDDPQVGSENIAPYKTLGVVIGVVTGVVLFIPVKIAGPMVKAVPVGGIPIFGGLLLHLRGWKGFSAIGEGICPAEAEFHAVKGALFGRQEPVNIDLIGVPPVQLFRIRGFQGDPATVNEPAHRHEVTPAVHLVVLQELPHVGGINLDNPQVNGRKADRLKGKGKDALLGDDDSFSQEADFRIKIFKKQGEFKGFREGFSFGAAEAAEEGQPAFPCDFAGRPEQEVVAVDLPCKGEVIAQGHPSLGGIGGGKGIREDHFHALFRGGVCPGGEYGKFAGSRNGQGKASLLFHAEGLAVPFQEEFPRGSIMTHEAVGHKGMGFPVGGMNPAEGNFVAIEGRIDQGFHPQGIFHVGSGHLPGMGEPPEAKGRPRLQPLLLQGEILGQGGKPKTEPPERGVDIHEAPQVKGHPVPGIPFQGLLRAKLHQPAGSGHYLPRSRRLQPEHLLRKHLPRLHAGRYLRQLNHHRSFHGNHPRRK